MKDHNVLVYDVVHFAFRAHCEVGALQNLCFTYEVQCFPW